MTRRINLPTKPVNFPAIVRWTWDNVQYRFKMARGPLKGRTVVEVQAFAVLPDNFDARRDCGGFDELQAMTATVAEDAVTILNAAVVGRQPGNGETIAETLLRQILTDLPTKRDWLDPQVEAAAKKLLNITT